VVLRWICWACFFFEVPGRLFGTEILARACRLLENTALTEKAVGLAAEQCGVDARIVYLQQGWSAENRFAKHQSLTLVNPRIVGRSPETEMKVWEEHCLVLPPNFTATVLRDSWIDVEYQSAQSGDWNRIRLSGEPARAFQHEYDHDRGILITDHVGLDALANYRMDAIEKDGHGRRMAIAYARHVDEPVYAA